MTNSVMKKLFSAPFVAFILCGTLVPMGVIAWYGLTDRSGAFTVENVAAMFGGDHAKALGLSLALSLISTAICLLLAFPLGLLLRDSGLGKKGFMVFLFILPMWMNFLLRTMAWQVLLEKGGILNTILGAFGRPALEMINTPTAVVLGMVYDYLPFMVLPIYVSLEQMDKRLLEAASDLGAAPFTAFRKITLPLTLPGVAAGSILVFISSLGMFVVPDIMGGAKSALMGNVIQNQFLAARDWPFGSALSIILALLSLVMIVLYYKSLEAQKGGKSHAEKLA